MYKHEAPPDRATTDRIQNRAVFPSFLVQSGRYPSAVWYAFRTTTLPIPPPVAPVASELLSRDGVGKLVQAIVAWHVPGRCFGARGHLKQMRGRLKKMKYFGLKGDASKN